MAARSTTQAGNILDASTWGGSLFGSSDDLTILHACTLNGTLTCRTLKGNGTSGMITLGGNSIINISQYIVCTAVNYCIGMFIVPNLHNLTINGNLGYPSMSPNVTGVYWEYGELIINGDIYLKFMSINTVNPSSIIINGNVYNEYITSNLIQVDDGSIDMTGNIYNSGDIHYDVITSSAGTFNLVGNITNDGICYQCILNQGTVSITGNILNNVGWIAFNYGELVINGQCISNEFGIYQLSGSLIINNPNNSVPILQSVLNVLERTGGSIVVNGIVLSTNGTIVNVVNLNDYHKLTINGSIYCIGTLLDQDIIVNFGSYLDSIVSADVIIMPLIEGGQYPTYTPFIGLPNEADVLKGVTYYDADGLPFNKDKTGTLDLPSNEDIVVGVSSGTMDLPDKSEVRSGTTYGTITGNYDALCSDSQCQVNIPKNKAPSKVASVGKKVSLKNPPPLKFTPR